MFVGRQQTTCLFPLAFVSHFTLISFILLQNYIVQPNCNQVICFLIENYSKNVQYLKFPKGPPMNSFVFIPHMHYIPQWKQCYYDYETLQKILDIIHYCQEELEDIKKAISLQRTKSELLFQYTIPQSQKCILDSSQLVEINQSSQMLGEKKKQMERILDKWCFKFIQYSHETSSLAYMFILMRTYQINGKLKQYKKLLCLVKNQHHNMTILLENLYIEAFYVSQAIKYNLALEVKATQIFEIFSQKHPGLYLEKFSYNHSLRRIQTMNNQIIQDIEHTYLLTSLEKQKDAFNLLQKIIAKNTNQTYNRIIMVGLGMGVIVFLIVALVMTDSLKNTQLWTNEILANQFPIWRGVSYILFYMWMLSLDILFYEKSQINYRLIFHYESHNMPGSRYLFLNVSILSIIFMLLLYMFTLEVQGVVERKFLYEGAIFWLLIVVIIFIFSPLKLRKQKKAQFYFYNILFTVLKTPCVPASFMIIWITEQFASFNQPFGDLFYTICYYSNNNAQYCFKNAPYASTGYILFVFIYRMIQNMKMWFQNAQLKPDKKGSFTDPPFVGFFRAFFSFFTTIFALFERQKLFNGTWTLWLIFSIWTTLYSWFIDIKVDWGILNFNSKTLLRKKLLFPKAKIVYYFIAVFDLILRAAWVLTISPLNIQIKGFHNMLFIMGVSYLQIFRRGMWNIFRIEFEHIKNCQDFKATINDSNILKQVKEAAKQEQEKNQRKSQSRTQLGSLFNLASSRTRLPRKISKIIVKIQDQSESKLSEQRTSSAKQIFKEKIEQRRRIIKGFRKQMQNDWILIKQIQNRIEKLQLLKEILSIKSI